MPEPIDRTNPNDRRITYRELPLWVKLGIVVAMPLGVPLGMLRIYETLWTGEPPRTFILQAATSIGSVGRYTHLSANHYITTRDLWRDQ